MSNKFLPMIDRPAKATTAICDTIFEELDSALVLMDSMRGELNPIQQQLLSRFLATCKLFGHDMLLAEGNRAACAWILGLSGTDEVAQSEDTASSAQALVDEVWRGVSRDLAQISSAVQGELRAGVVDVIDSIRAEHAHTLQTSDCLDAMAHSVRHLADQIAALFDVQPYVLKRYHKLLDATPTRTPQDELEAACAPSASVSVEAFMLRVKPPIKRSSIYERLKPYVPQLRQLREQGYTYAQCVQFLQENGIQTYPAAISQALYEDKRSTPEKSRGVSGVAVGTVMAA